mmetsp:Transcript_17416/g.49175  ORF Transcript_17416/g.49175 Transcript_17416/m.49175 type:complete len:243 (+) Transcript_17416:1401-2129(+)
MTLQGLKPKSAKIAVSSDVLALFPGVFVSAFSSERVAGGFASSGTVVGTTTDAAADVVSFPSVLASELSLTTRSWSVVAADAVAVGGASSFVVVIVVVVSSTTISGKTKSLPSPLHNCVCGDVMYACKRGSMDALTMAFRLEERERRPRLLFGRDDGFSEPLLDLTSAATNVMVVNVMVSAFSDDGFCGSGAGSFCGSMSSIVVKKLLLLASSLALPGFLLSPSSMRLTSCRRYGSGRHGMM